MEEIYERNRSSGVSSLEVELEVVMQKLHEMERSRRASSSGQIPQGHPAQKKLEKEVF